MVNKANSTETKNNVNSSKIKQSLQMVTGFCSVFHTKVYKFFNLIGKKLAKAGVSANLVSIIGFIIGITAVNFLALENYGYALVCIVLNRAFDILDGAVAKHSKVTDFGVFLDAALDYIFYAGVIFGFALAAQENAVAAAFLLFAFAASAFAMLGYAVIAYKNNVEKELELSVSPFYLGGIAQGFETFIALVVLCLLPKLFVPIALLLGALCLFKALGVIATAYYSFVIAARKK